MATVGQQLTAPEAGWKRYDDVDENITYTSGWTSVNVVNANKGSYHQISNAKKTEYASFNFYGAQIRLISTIASWYSNNAYISIDGIEYSLPVIGSSTIYQALVFSLVDLELKEHYVQIFMKYNGSANGLCVDAIDIDENGELKPYNPTPISAPANLTAIPGDAQVTLNWDAVIGATNYNVKRSTIAGGPYETIATTVTGTSYVDTNVTNGTTYYYVVTAVNADGESANSNEASATPQAAPIEEGNVLLRITMNDSSEREYKVTQTVADDFITWCNRTIGTGNACYVFDKSTQSSKEYLFYEKIISFEVIPLPAE